MAQKFIHKVSPELTDDSQFKAISDIPTAALTQGSSIRMYPGEYSAVTANLDNITIVGVGDPADVVIHKLSLNNNSANTITVENITIKGTNAAADSGTSAVEIMETDNTVVTKFRNVIFSNAEHAVRNHGSGVVTLDLIDATGVDQAIVSNANVTVNYSKLNTTTNAYGTPGGAIQTHFFMTGSHAVGSNTGNSVEIVRELKNKSYTDIALGNLVPGDIINLFPGEHAQISADLDDVDIIGIGNRDDIIVHQLTFTNSSANTVTVENITIKGTNAAADSDVAAAEMMETDNAVITKFRNVVFSNAEHAVRNHGSGVVTLDSVTASGVDQAVVSNANVTINFGYLNTSSNAYGATGGAIQTNFFVTASYSAGSNTGDTVETVRALIS